MRKRCSRISTKSFEQLDGFFTVSFQFNSVIMTLFDLEVFDI